jgi:hypothetical protein
MLVLVEQQETINDSYDSPEEYGEWRVDRTAYISKVSRYSKLLSVRQRKINGDIYQINKEFDHEMLIFVVSLIYSDGDSFGHSTGNGLVIWAFSDEILAEKCRVIIEESKDESAFCFDVEDGNGSTKTVQLSNPACGYFETVEYVKVESFKIGFELYQ